MIGLIVNPVAGLGGTVGLKGTDGVAEKALEMGAVPESGRKAVRMLTHLKTDIITCGGPMGAEAAEKAGINYEVVYEPSYPTTSADTVKAATIMEKTVDLLLFCGGDGTARDISSAVSIPILGVPTGVKMYSACFAVTPELAAEISQSFLNKQIMAEYCEILDIDEALYRKGKLSVTLFGYARVPQHVHVQTSKHIIGSSYHQKREIGGFISRLIREDTVYIIGAGTTTKAIGDSLNIEKTLLGVDVLKGRKLLKKDCSEKDILEILRKEKKATIIVSPIGGQGFIFGRGNQQLSPEVIRTVGIQNIVVVAVPEKLMSTPILHVDTGNRSLDETLKGDYLVICGYQLAARKKVG
jgi:predicted polyphosphate/ATP-dependent NAD kinase